MKLAQIRLLKQQISRIYSHSDKPASFVPYNPGSDFDALESGLRGSTQMNSAHKSAKDEASKYGIYEVEAKLDPSRARDHLDFKKEFDSKAKSLGLSEGDDSFRVFDKDNRQTANGFSAEKQAPDMTMTSRKNMKRHFEQTLDKNTVNAGA